MKYIAMSLSLALMTAGCSNIGSIQNGQANSGLEMNVAPTCPEGPYFHVQHQAEGVYRCVFDYYVENKSVNPVSANNFCFVTYDGRNFTNRLSAKFFLNPGESYKGSCEFEIPAGALIQSVSLRDSSQKINSSYPINSKPENLPQPLIKY
jgi:hypothetical protein